MANASPGPSLLKRIDQTHVPILIAHAVLGVMFIEYGVIKAGHPVEFLKQIREYHLFPESPPYFINLTAVVLPWIEMVCGLMLLTGLWHRAAGAVTLLMLVVFTGAIFVRAVGVYQQGDDPFCTIEFDCGCGAGVILICKKLLTNSCLVALSLIVILSKARLATLAPVLSTRRAVE